MRTRNMSLLKEALHQAWSSGWCAALSSGDRDKDRNDSVNYLYDIYRKHLKNELDDVMNRVRFAKDMPLEEKRYLMSSVIIEDGNLIIWTCEPSQVVAKIDNIPQLASMKYASLLLFELSSTGSRIHWNDGDIDLIMEDILPWKVALS